MIVKNIFSDSIPALAINDSAQRALHFMEFFKISSLPIVNDNLFVGMISEDVILDAEKKELLLTEFPFENENTFICSDQHIYDAVLQMSMYKLSLLAVVDKDKKYLGTISPITLIDTFSKITSLDRAGSTLIIKIGIRDYVLSEIAQIAESNQVKILSSYVQTCKDQHNLKITLRLNTTDLTAFKAGLERYNYTIEAVFSENQVVDEMYKNRLDELMHYMNI